LEYHTVHLDFSPVNNGTIKLIDLARPLNIDDLRAATNTSIDAMLNIIADLDDLGIAFIPDDPDAYDRDAPPEEQYIGWNIGHLIAHVTASSEEWAAYSSILARGIVYGKEPRLRYETPWREIITKAQAVQRLEESRRIRLGYLDTWPDMPNLNVYRELSDRFIAKHGPINAPAAFLYGLKHEVGHYEQIQEAARQALGMAAQA
jgi:hypothetical protein